MFAFPSLRLSCNTLGLTGFCSKLLLRSSVVMEWVSTFLYAFCLGFKRLIRFFLSSGLSSYYFSEPSFVSRTLFPNNYSSPPFLSALPLKKIFFSLSCVFFYKWKWGKEKWRRKLNLLSFVITDRTWASNLCAWLRSLSLCWGEPSGVPSPETFLMEPC